jgi:hypothetical protein
MTGGVIYIYYLVNFKIFRYGFDGELDIYKSSPTGSKSNL